MYSKLKSSALAVALSVTAPATAFADIYYTADFTFAVSGGDANQGAPFQGVAAPYPAGGSFTGNLVYDQICSPAPARVL